MAPNVSPPAELTQAGPTSTPPLPLSKRDKRRNAISERVSEMFASFADNRDQHYRAQLQAVQVDMNLIMNADPYSNSPLDESPEGINELINAATNGSLAPGSETQADYIAQVGKHYTKFVEEVNDAMEERDCDLAMLMNRYEAGLSEVHQTHTYKVRLAREEYQILANTVRERLIQTVSQKRMKVLRDKDQLDIADSNPLLLHPNQYSIVNPASPGGAQSNRKTRHTRHRLDPDELSGPAVAQDNKRRRKTAYEQNDAGSPDPGNRNVDMVERSPFREAKAKLIHAQFEAPLMSVEKLFTEKELSLVKNNAKMAANHHFSKLRTQDKDGPPPPVNADAGTIDADTSISTTLPATGSSIVPEAGEADSPPPTAPEMDRTAGTSHMTTRGTVRNNNTNNSGIHALSDLALAAERALPFAPQPHQPVIIPASQGARANAAAPTPSGVSAAEFEHDFALFRRALSDNAAISAQLLDLACRPPATRHHEYRAPMAAAPDLSAGRSAGVGPSAGSRGRVGSAAVGLAAPAMELGGVPMSAQSSVGGLSELAGGVAMSRVGNGSSMGGIGMQRTASGAGRRGKGKARAG